MGRVVGRPEYRLRGSEYVGTVRREMEEVIAELRACGFTWGPFSWYHQPPVGTSPDGSWTYRPWVLADRQLHVILAAREPGRIDVYAHEEYDWLRHPVKHFRQMGIEREAGAAAVRRWFDERGLDVDAESRTRRSVACTVERYKERLLARFGPSR